MYVANSDGARLFFIAQYAMKKRDDEDVAFQLQDDVSAKDQFLSKNPLCPSTQFLRAQILVLP